MSEIQRSKKNNRLIDPKDENSLQKAWRILHNKPMGKTLFSIALGRIAPYTGSIGARITELRKGYCKVILRDRKKVRNHLNSIHAMALVNLAEVSTGVAMMYSLPPSARGILTGFEIEYVKKSRGTITAECHCAPPATTERKEYLVETTLRDQNGDTVATATAKWLIGPKKQKES